LRKIRKDGAVLWVEEVAQAVYDLSGSLNVLVVCQDITDRKRMEEVVRNCETRFRRLFETATDGILIIDANTGEIVDVNPYLLDVLGCSREEMLGRKLWDLCPPAKDLALSEEAFAELQQKHIRYEDLPLVTHDGTPIAVEFISNVHEIDGTRLIQCNIRDITDRKRAEEEICRLNAHLRERAEELELANKELEAFNFTVAHDLRQPLNLLGTYCQAIMRLCSYQLTEECAGYVQKGYEVTQRMNRTIESLLHFSQVGHVDPRREPIDLDRMAHEVAKELATTDPDRQVEFRIDEGIIAKADANLIRLALDNLLGNAWKYTSEQQRPVIEFGAKEVGGEEIYFVRDNGAGFDMADAAKVFAPFQRLAGAEDRAGFGIGLATVENIVRRHGGRIWAESEPGKGATFYFTIPAAEEGDPCQ
jgi:PAS domain S-box-containing protein